MHNNRSTFVQTDLDILKSRFEVRELWFRRDSAHLVRSMVNSVRGALWADAVVSWFGAFHALFPFAAALAANRNRLIIASGYDVADVSTIGYGNMRKGPKRLIGSTVFALANRVLAVSKFTAGELARNTAVPSWKVRVIHHGFPLVEPTDYVDKVDRVITVASITGQNLQLKGLRTFVKAASFLPDVEFVLIGPALDSSITYLKSIASPNVRMTGAIPNAFKSGAFRHAKVYVQASLYESFGCALAEAMLQGCIPVVTRLGALPEVVGDTGFFVADGDVQGTVSAIRQALDAGRRQAERARQRVIERFPLERRAKLLISAIEETAR